MAQCSIYALLRCPIMTVLSLRKIQFYISVQYRAEVADTAVCTPDFAVLPSALSDSPIDSLNHTSYNNCQQKIIHSAQGIALMRTSSIII